MITEFVVPGCLVSDLDKKAENYIKSRGARPAFKGYMGFPSTLCVSIEDAVVHGIPNEITLEEGQIVGIDCGAGVLNTITGKKERMGRIVKMHADDTGSTAERSIKLRLKER